MFQNLAGFLSGRSKKKKPIGLFFFFPSFFFSFPLALTVQFTPSLPLPPKIIIISFSRSFVRDWEPDLGGAVKTPE